MFCLVVVAAQNFATDVVHLRLCQHPSCVVACFRDCECKIEKTNTTCETTTPPSTPAPTPVPQAGPVATPQQCAMKSNQARCAEVAVDTNLRAGEECEWCYNFCNGKFLGCCAEDGQCSQNPCTEDEDGNKEEVFGCPVIRITDPKTSAPTASGGGSGGVGSGAATTGHLPVLATVAALMLLVRELN